MLFADLLSLHLVTFLMFFILVVNTVSVTDVHCSLSDWDLKMIRKKSLVLLQVLAILIAEFQYGTRAAGQGDERYSNRILSSIFYPYLTARYAVIASGVLSFFLTPVWTC